VVEKAGLPVDILETGMEYLQRDTKPGIRKKLPTA